MSFKHNFYLLDDGRTVDFRNTVVIMTSNLGSAAIMDLTLSDQEISDRVMAEVRGSFRPEFLNRVDDIVIFHRLTADHLRQIVDIQVGQLERRLAERKISIELTDKAREWLADRGFDPAYGARPLKRLLQKEIADRLALRLLQGEFGEGDRVEVDGGDGGLRFSAV